jgi:hypothetical protein
MMHNALRVGILAACLAWTIPARAEEESAADLLQIIGTFVKDGLTPARTAEDVMREEQHRLQAKKESQPKPDEAPASPVAAAAPAPMPAPAVPQAAPQPAESAPARGDVPAAKAPQPAAKAVAQQQQPRGPILAAPPPRPAPPPEARPKPAAAPHAAPPAPEPSGSRIAATATLDQAMRLGGAASLYAQRIKPPVRN